MDILSPVLQADEVVLFVLVSFVIGTGVVVGRGWITPVGGGAFVSFWRGFCVIVAWSVMTALILAILGPPVVLLLQRFAIWVPALNFFVFGIASLSMAYHVNMINRAKVGIAILFILGVASVAIPVYLVTR